MTAVALICATMLAFIQTVPAIAIFCPAVIYGLIFSSKAARQSDSNTVKTAILGGVAAVSANFIFVSPLIIGYASFESNPVPPHRVVFPIAVMEFFALIIGLVAGVFCDVFHLFTTHSNARRLRTDLANYNSVDVDDTSEFEDKCTDATNRDAQGAKTG